MDSDIKRSINGVIDGILKTTKTDIERGYSHSPEFVNGMVVALDCVISHLPGYDKERNRINEFKKSWENVEEK